MVVATKDLTRIPFYSYIIDGSLLWPGGAIPFNIPNIQQIMDKVKSFIWLGKKLGKIYSTKESFQVRKQGKQGGLTTCHTQNNLGFSTQLCQNDIWEIYFGLNGRVEATHTIYHILLENLSVRTISKGGLKGVIVGNRGRPCQYPFMESIPTNRKALSYKLDMSVKKTILFLGVERYVVQRAFR